MNPDNNQNNITDQPQQVPSVPQLENETPLDITIYPNSENQGNEMDSEKFPPQAPIQTPVNFDSAVSNQSSSTESLIQDKEQLPPIPSVSFTEPNLNPLPNIDNPQTNNAPLNSSNNQKVAIIGGILLGILTVSGISVYYLSTLSKPLQTQTFAPTITQALVPQIQNLTNSEYKLKIEAEIEKLNSIAMNNPINFEMNNINTTSIEFVGNEIFAIATEINEINSNSEETRMLNEKLYNNLTNLVAHLDLVLKTYKDSTMVSVNQRQQFQAEYLRLANEIATTNLEIKNLQ
jgi:hypothetical protein